MKAISVLFFVVILMCISAIAMLITSKQMLTNIENKNVCHQKVIIGTECELTYRDVYGFDIGYPFPYQQTEVTGDSSLNIRNLTIDYIIWLGATTILALPIYALLRKLVIKIKCN